MLLLLAAVIAASVIGSRGDLPEAQTAMVKRRALLESKVTANVERDFAKIELRRNAELIEQGIVSRSVYDAAKMRFDVTVAAVKSAQARAEQARTRVRDAELRVAQSRAALRAAQARAEQAHASLRRESDLLSKTTQHSPIKGVIASLPIQVGTFALANFQSTPLMIIADMSSINVEARVDETDVTSVKVGQKVEIKVDALGDRKLDGEVAEIASSAVTRTGQITMKKGEIEWQKNSILFNGLRPRR
jgi:HlyD family secretion protein